MHDVARLAGVSIKTVSNVINDYEHVRPATRSKVRAAIAELGYRPNMSARNLRRGRTGAIGLAVPELSLAYFAQLADEVIEVAQARGLAVLIEQTGGGNRERELEVLRSPRRSLTDGLLFSPLGMDNDDAGLVDIGTPVVLLGERIFGGPVDHVTMRNVDAAAAATAHLIERGRRRVAVLGAHAGEVIGSAGLRLTGYRRALEEAGIAFDEGLVGYMDTWHRANGAEAMGQVIDRGVEFDAVFAMNDELALGALRRLQHSGRRVPQDVMIIGFDDVDEGQYSLPSLSTVDPGRPEIARTAIDMLQERIDGPAVPPREVLTDFRVVPRESTATTR